MYNNGKNKVTKLIEEVKGLKKRIVLLYFFILIGGLIGCQPRAKIVEELQKVEAMEAFEEYNGFRVENGRFYFTAIHQEQFNVYAMDINTKDLEKVFTEIHAYDSFIPLEEQGAVYVDTEGNLFYKKQGKEIKIDEKITGFNSPNVLVSPNREGVLYTKGTNQQSSLYRYMLDEKQPQLIVNNIPQDAYINFSFTTQWSNKINYFVFNNNEVYNDEGEKIATIEASSLRWSPNDRYIAYIEVPQHKIENKIIIGEWETYIGDKLKLYDIEENKQHVIMENPSGFIDPIDGIQWSRDSSKVAILEGNIVKGEENYLERMEYQNVGIYNLPKQEVKRVENFKYNYYQILFTDLIYGKNLGIKEGLEIVSINDDKRKIYDAPTLLNNRDMFIIMTPDKAYLVNGTALIEVNPKGEDRKLIDLPWEVNTMYFDEKNNKLIIINQNQEMFLYSLKN